MTRLFPLLLALVLAAPTAPAQTEQDSPTRTQPDVGAAVEGEPAGSLTVATKEAAPFSMKGPDGQWTGISIELFRTIADELDLEYSLQEASLQEIVDGVADGRFDAGVAALSITPDRERRVDFTFPFYSTGLGIAVNPSIGGGWLQVVRNFFSLEFLAVLASLSAVLFAAGFAVWFFERRGNPDEFSNTPLRGVFEGFWWAAVTMTTVGYGDKSPRTIGGRVVGLVWMFAAMIIVASFTAAIAASLTVGQLGGKVRTVDDLQDVRVGVLANSASAEELADRRIASRGYETVEAGLDALADARIDAFVHDRPLLRYTVQNAYQGTLKVLPDPIGRQDYGIALGEGSGLREAVNRALLARIRSEEWSRVLMSYLGAEED